LTYDKADKVLHPQITKRLIGLGSILSIANHKSGAGHGVESGSDLIASEVSITSINYLPPVVKEPIMYSKLEEV
jgi:hypothetical protein